MHASIRKRLGVNLFYTDALGDTVTIVTKKSEKHQGEWIPTGDIRARFPCPRAAGSTFEQQRNQDNSKDTHASRLLGHSWQICPTLIPIRHIGETSQDDSLDKVYKSCTILKGKDINCINQLFRESPHDIYDMLLDIDA